MESIHELKAVLARANSRATDGELDAISWMVGGFSPDHLVRRQAKGLHRIERLLARQRPCKSEIHTVMRVLTCRTEQSLVGNVADCIFALIPSKIGATSGGPVQLAPLPD